MSREKCVEFLCATRVRLVGHEPSARSESLRDLSGLCARGRAHVQDAHPRDNAQCRDDLVRPGLLDKKQARTHQRV